LDIPQPFDPGFETPTVAAGAVQIGRNRQSGAFEEQRLRGLGEERPVVAGVKRRHVRGEEKLFDANRRGGRCRPVHQIAEA